jgi:hypothetical protein
MSMSVNDLIKQRGGVDEISAASARTEKPVTADTVHKWRKNGIPEVHWPIFISAGVSVEVLFRANELLRRKKAKHEDDALPKRRSSSRVAA